MVLARLAPERMTMSQAIFFLVAGSADLAGEQPTYTAIKDQLGDQLNRSLHTTYRIFMEPSRAFPKGLGWLTSEVCSADNRVKILSLTPEGKKVMQALAASMNGKSQHHT